MPQNFSPNTWVVQRLEALRVSLATLEAPKGSVCPVGTCMKRKATRRGEQIQALRAASAHSADVCEERKRALAERAPHARFFDTLTPPLKRGRRIETN